ncbi:hypothetical protein JG688_00003865 [Phytophthora aleatoria]|uniref:Uncharacterized protein n=1 Tax=Phytophthora aleatoria TaxID=2496075 RepID=A0A8J5JEJ9_9STRA|nr:hypothetical protein JG688_00003865 [Phytophthora aleatoria]
MLLLFRPFRNKFDLVPVEQSLEESYCVWWQSPAALQARNFENNAMDYYASRELASARVDEDMLRYSEYGDTPTNTSIDEECLDLKKLSRVICTLPEKRMEWMTYFPEYRSVILVIFR